MQFADVWESDKLPQELKDMILDAAVPRHLQVRVYLRHPHAIGGRLPANFFEAVELSRWGTLAELLDHSAYTRRIALDILEKETSIVIVDPNHTHISRDRSFIWGGRVIQGEECSDMIEVSESFLNRCDRVQVTEPFILSFGRTLNDDFTDRNILLRCTVRCQIPKSTRSSHYAHSIECQLNSNSCMAYSPACLLWHLKDTKRRIERQIQMYEIDYGVPMYSSGPQGFIADAQSLTAELEDHLMYGALFNVYYPGANEYRLRITWKDDARAEYKRIGQPGSAWSNEWEDFDVQKAEGMVQSLIDQQNKEESEEGKGGLDTS